MLTPSTNEGVKGANALGTPVIAALPGGANESVSPLGAARMERCAMTRRRSLKRRIRTRMASTGESYTTARRHVINRMEAESPTGRPGSQAGVGPRRRRPIWIAAVGLALVGAAVAAVIVAAGGDGSNDSAEYAGSSAPPSAVHPPAAEQVPCSEVLRPALLAIDHPEKCFRLHGRGPTAKGAISLAAMQRACGGAHPNPPKGPCAFDLSPEQRPLVQVERPSAYLSLR
jgi:hypothetical protein